MKDRDLLRFIRYLQTLSFEQLCILASWCLQTAVENKRREP